MARIVNEAAGRGRANLVLAALDRLDEVSRGAYGSAIFDFEERETTDAKQLIGIIDRTIVVLEASRDRRQCDGGRIGTTLAA
ncbi:MAG: hypothetical protein ABI401_16050 [Candidatus Dormibacter sp.]